MNRRVRRAVSFGQTSSFHRASKRSESIGGTAISEASSQDPRVTPESTNAISVLRLPKSSAGRRSARADGYRSLQTFSNCGTSFAFAEGAVCLRLNRSTPWLAVKFWRMESTLTENWSRRSRCLPNSTQRCSSSGNNPTLACTPASSWAKSSMRLVSPRRRRAV